MVKKSIEESSLAWLSSLSSQEPQRLKITRPEAIEPDPEDALGPTKTEALGLAGRDYRPLLAEREDLEVKGGPASEEAEHGNRDGKQYGSHRRDGIASHWEKSM